MIRAHIQDSTSQRRTRKHSSGRWLYFGHVGSVEQSKPKRSRFLDRCLFIFAEQLVSEDVVAIKLRSLWHLDCTHSHKAIPHHVQIPDLENKTRVYSYRQVVANKIQMNFSLSDKQIRTLDNRETQAHVIHVPNFHFILLNKCTCT